MSDTRFSRLNKARSRFILQSALSWKEKDQEEIATLSQGIPVALRSQGLVVLMARLIDNEKNSSAYTFLKMLFEWLKQAMPLSGFSCPKTSIPVGFLEELLVMEHPVYLACQAEAMEFAEQAKLILKAVNGGKGGA